MSVSQTTNLSLSICVCVFVTRSPNAFLNTLEFQTQQIVQKCTAQVFRIRIAITIAHLVWSTARKLTLTYCDRCARSAYEKRKHKCEHEKNVDTQSVRIDIENDRRDQTRSARSRMKSYVCECLIAEPNTNGLAIGFVFVFCPSSIFGFLCCVCVLCIRTCSLF